jgi:hypothetical protein
VSEVGASSQWTIDWVGNTTPEEPIEAGAVGNARKARLASITSLTLQFLSVRSVILAGGKYWISIYPTHPALSQSEKETKQFDAALQPHLLKGPKTFPAMDSSGLQGTLEASGVEGNSFRLLSIFAGACEEVPCGV